MGDDAPGHRRDPADLAHENASVRDWPVEIDRHGAARNLFARISRCSTRRRRLARPARNRRRADERTACAASRRRRRLRGRHPDAAGHWRATVVGIFPDYGNPRGRCASITTGWRFISPTPRACIIRFASRLKMSRRSWRRCSTRFGPKIARLDRQRRNPQNLDRHFRAHLHRDGGAQRAHAHRLRDRAFREPADAQQSAHRPYRAGLGHRRHAAAASRVWSFCASCCFRRARRFSPFRWACS